MFTKTQEHFNRHFGLPAITYTADTESQVCTERLVACLLALGGYIVDRDCSVTGKKWMPLVQCGDLHGVCFRGLDHHTR